ncbi:C40 family peptidase [Alkalihalobacillus sp. AL-G]|uniref:C40 family peptidase n=1 Tax=Alkalihalobacillus sp. AL-G TaxID=2926399 RepID=UPI00272C2810|nr:C40 family peptidase [Alkalihalobacillus sp. AL-G]WLD92817.1 C40 family peptidase [Alkalihalobacillus sp. AL-G]
MNLVKKWIVVFLSIILVASLASNTAFAKSVQDYEPDTAYVDVAAATFWVEPDLLRPVDEPSATNPVDLHEWTSKMTYEEKLWLVGNLETQALLGSKVTILEERGDWMKVAAHEQPTPRNEFGYPGWVPKRQLTDGKSFGQMVDRLPFALVTEPTTWLYDDKGKSAKFMEISMNTRLPVLNENGDMVLVMTPSDGAKWLVKQDVDVYESKEDIRKPTAADMLETAKKFLGLPYLWAGMSGFGFDCSGFTHTVFKTNGITIPRDSSVQAKHGTPVARENLQPGDLIFFAYNNGEGRVHHVGMYIGDGKMIHSPNTSSTVRIDDYDAPGYGEEYAGARRYWD